MTKYTFSMESPFDIPAPLEDYCLSPSSLNKFLLCPAAFLWDKVFKMEVPEEPWPEADLGTAVHKLAENTWKEQLSIDRCKDLISMNKATGDEQTQCLNRLLQVEVDRMEEEGASCFKPLYTEMSVASWKNRRVGYLDRIDLMPDGNLRVVDYKPYGEKVYDSTKRQLIFYATQVNFKIDNGELLAPEGSRVTVAEVIGYKDGKRTEVGIKKVSVTALEKRIAKFRQTTHFPCTPGYGKMPCGYCKYQTNVCLQTNMERW